MSVQLLRTVSGQPVEIIVLDAVISHVITFAATITTHPIEEGSKVSDHVEIDPDGLVLVGKVTNTPVTLLSGGLIPRFDPTRSKGAYDALVATFRGKELVQIVDELAVFDDMAIERLEVPRDISNFHALDFTATFKKLTKVGTQVVELSADAEKIAAPSEDLGKQTPVDANGEETTESSTLVSILKGVGLVE